MLTHDAAKQCFDLIKESALTALRRQLIRAATDYAHLRAVWQISEREERRQMDQRRTLAHNAFIDCCNILSRSMEKADEDNSWREVLGDDRKRIGDFACYVHLFLGLEAR
jgi:hypothetical protein